MLAFLAAGRRERKDSFFRPLSTKALVTGSATTTSASFAAWLATEIEDSVANKDWGNRRDAWANNAENSVQNTKDHWHKRYDHEKE